MHTILRKQNIGYIAAGVGAAVGLLGLLTLPYATVQLNMTFFVTLRIAVRTYFFLDVPQEMPANPFDATSDHLPYTIPIQGGLGYGIIWLAVLLTVAALFIALDVLFIARMRSKFFPIALLVIGTVSTIVQLYIVLDAAHEFQNRLKALIDIYNGTGTPGPFDVVESMFAISVKYEAGGWILLLGTLTVVLGSLFTILYKPKSATGTAYQNMPGAGMPRPKGSQWPGYAQPEATYYPRQAAPVPASPAAQPVMPPSQSEVIAYPQEPAPQRPYEHFGSPPPEQPGW